MSILIAGKDTGHVQIVQTRWFVSDRFRSEYTSSSLTGKEPLKDSRLHVNERNGDQVLRIAVEPEVVDPGLLKPGPTDEVSTIWKQQGPTIDFPLGLPTRMYMERSTHLKVLELASMYRTAQRSGAE